MMNQAAMWGKTSWLTPTPASSGSRRQRLLKAQQGKPVGRADRRDPCPHTIRRTTLVQHEEFGLIPVTSEVACTRKASHQGKTSHRNTDGTEWA